MAGGSPVTQMLARTARCCRPPVRRTAIRHIPNVSRGRACRPLLIAGDVCLDGLPAVLGCAQAAVTEARGRPRAARAPESGRPSTAARCSPSGPASPRPGTHPAPRSNAGSTIGRSGAGSGCTVPWRCARSRSRSRGLGSGNSRTADRSASARTARARDPNRARPESIPQRVCSAGRRGRHRAPRRGERDRIHLAAPAGRERRCACDNRSTASRWRSVLACT